MTRKSFTRWLFITGLLLAILCTYTYLRLRNLGAFTDASSSFRGACSVVAEVPGPEALQLDRETGILYFISNNPCTGPNPRGGIYYLKLDSPNALARPFEFDRPKDFHPHGLSFFRDNQGEKFLFTNNHRDDGSHTVEIFSITSGDELEHEISISGNELISPNDLVAVGPRQFYVTNDGRSHDSNTRSIDTFLGRKTGNILYYDGNEFTEAAHDLYFPNGIAIDPPTNTLFVGETLSGTLKVYQIAPGSTLENVDNFFIGTGIDNISIDESGQLWVAVHPNLWALSKHMKDTQTTSPSKVFKVNYRPYSKKLIFADDGTILSGLSAAISVEKHLYLGAVCKDKLLKCSYSIQD